MNPTKFYKFGNSDKLGVVHIGTNRNTCLEIISCVAIEVGLKAAFLYYAIAEESALLEESKNVYGESIDVEGYISLPAYQLEELTSLTRKEQETAIKKLANAGYIQVVKYGMPMRKCFKILK